MLPAVGESGVAKRKRFGTFRAELIQMRKWLKLSKVTEIAMESTGVYWRSLWNVLQDPAQVKALHGRQSDRREAQRIAEFLQDGRLDGVSSLQPRCSACGSCCGIGSRWLSNATKCIITSAICLRHCASWAGLVPAENESAGHSKHNGCRKGNRVLRRVLTQAA